MASMTRTTTLRSNLRTRPTRPATSITTTTTSSTTSSRTRMTTSRSTTEEVFQGWRYKLQSTSMWNNSPRRRRKDFFENSSRKLHPDDEATTTIQRGRSSTSPTPSPTPISPPSPTPSSLRPSRNQKEVVRAPAEAADEDNVMSSTTELLTIVTEEKGTYNI